MTPLDALRKQNLSKQQKCTLPIITGVLISFASAGGVGLSGIQNPSAENTTAMNAINLNITSHIVEAGRNELHWDRLFGKAVLWRFQSMEVSN